MGHLLLQYFSAQCFPPTSDLEEHTHKLTLSMHSTPGRQSQLEYDRCLFGLSSWRAPSEYPFRLPCTYDANRFSSIQRHEFASMLRKSIPKFSHRTCDDHTRMLKDGGFDFCANVRVFRTAGRRTWKCIPRLQEACTSELRRSHRSHVHHCE